MKTQTHLRARALYPLLILCISLPQSAWGQATEREKNLNIYASLLDCTLDQETGKTATFKAAANTDGKNVSVYIYKRDENGVYSEEGTLVSSGGTVGASEINSLATATLPGGYYKWAVKVQGNGDFNTSGSFQESLNTNDYKVGDQSIRPACATLYYAYDNRYKFQYPKGLAVNAYHDSKYLGFSYVGEAGNLSLTSTTSNARRLGSSQGIYVFRPNLGMIWYGYKDNTAISSAPFGGFTGGISWYTPADDSKNKYFGPNRVSTDKDGYVYVAENRPAEKEGQIISENRIWRVHHDQMTTTNSPQFTCILTQTQLKTAQSGVNFAGRVLSMSVGYEVNDNGEEEKMLYVISGWTTSAIIAGAYLSSWKITENGNGSCTLTYTGRYLRLLDIADTRSDQEPHNLTSPQCTVVPGNHNGDLWIFQRTDAHDDITASGQFSALHLSKSGNSWVADYHIATYLNSSGTGAISTHQTLMSELEGTSGDYYLAMPCRVSDTNNRYVVRIFRIQVGNNGVPWATPVWSLYRDYTKNPYDGWGRPDNATTPAAGENIDGIAFDAANNLYFAASSRQYLFVYALPKMNEHITYGHNILHIPYKVTSWESSVTEDEIVNEKKTYMYDNDLMPVLSKEGYIFHGWYDNADFTGEPITSVQRDDITLYAKWTEIKINEGTEVDNTPVLNLVNAQDVSIKVNRKLQGGMFSTLCLPFSVTDEIMDQATTSSGTPLADATLWVFDNVSTDKEGTKTLHFTQTSTVDANTPFLILPTQDIAEDIFFHGVTISKPDSLEAAGEATCGDITFHGVINPVEIKAGTNTFFLVADNRLATPNNDSILPGLRGYFTAPEGAKLQIRTQQDTPTLLENVANNSQNAYKILQDGRIYIIRDQIIYDLQGNRVEADF